MTKCSQCGNADDMLVAFTRYRVCGKCVRRNHREATGMTTRNHAHARRRDARHTRALDSGTTENASMRAGGSSNVHQHPR